MKPSVSSILCILLSCLLSSCASQPTNTVTTDIGNLHIYPDLQRNVVHPGDSIVFEFNPKAENINIDAVRINTGEPGKSPLGCGSDNLPCTGRNIRVSYKYEKAGAYNVVVDYQGTPVAAKKIIICKRYPTDQELYYEAVRKVAEEVKEGIEQVAKKSRMYKGRMPKFAFSSLRNANFDYESQKDVEVIYSLMQALVEDKSKERYSPVDYAILERAPHALVRLAHEAVWVADPSLHEEKQLEYGLRTYYDSERPIVYGIKLAGINDTRSSVMTDKGGEEHDETSKENDRRERYRTQIDSDRQLRSKRPVMFARFDTADFLVVIDRIEDQDTPDPKVVQRSQADYYDTTYNTKAIKRTATVKVNARILDKSGQIMWIKDISQQASDLVLPDPKYAPPVQKWAEIKSGKPAQYSDVNLFTGLGSVAKKTYDYLSTQ